MRLTRTLVALFFFAVVLVPRRAGSGVEVKMLDAVSAASGSATTQRTAGYAWIRVQACGGTGGDAFSGTVSITQGSAKTAVVEVLALTLSGVDGCAAANYRTLNPAAWTGASYTRSAGKLTLYLEAY